MDEQTRLLQEIRDIVHEHKALYEERTRGVLKAQTMAVRIALFGVVMVLIAFGFVGYLAFVLLRQMH